MSQVFRHKDAAEVSVIEAGKKQAALGRLITEVSLTLNLSQITEDGLKVIAEAIGAEVSEIFLLESEPDDPEEQRRLRQVALHSPAEFRAAFSYDNVFEYGEGFPGLTIQKRTPIFTTNLISDHRFLRQKVKQQNFNLALNVPLRANDQIIGTLGLYSRNPQWRLSGEDIAFVEKLAEALAMAICNAQSYERMKQAQAGMNALSNAVEILNTSLNPRHVLVRLLSEAVKLIGANAGAIYLLNPGEDFLQPTATILIDPEWREKNLPLANSLAAEVLLTGTVRTVVDTSHTPERVYPALEETGRPGALVAAPLVRRGEVRGVLECYNVKPRSFSKQQLDLLTALASHAMLALRNAELHQELTRERHTADLERKKLRTILENSPEGLFFVAPDGTVVDCNQSSRDILRLEQIPDNFFQFEREYTIFQPDGTPRLYQEIPIVKALQEQVTTILQEAILRWPDNIEKNVLFSATPIYDEAGQFMGGFTVFQDISKLKEADKLKAKFLSMITHELKTPLASIKGTVSGLLQEDVEWDEASQKRFLHSIEEDVDGMVALVANLLDMARLQAGFMKPELEECYLSEVVEDASRKLRSLANAAHQKIKFEFAPEVLPVAADFLQIERVLVNLIGNALKYSPNDTIVIVSVKPAEAKAGSNLVEVAVADQGPGILPDEQEQIFKQFYRGKQVAGRTGRKVGTGLGLAICREIITLHGGQIWVEQREGGGSIFKFSLPALD